MIEFENGGRDLFGLEIIDEHYIIHDAKGGSGTTNKITYENLKVDFNQLLAHGRYTLNDAAMAIAEGTNASAKDIVNKLCLAAKNETLKMFDRSTGARYLYGKNFNSTVRDFYEVTTYLELNNWLSENEPLLNWRFPEPQSSDNRHEFTDKPVIDDDVNNGDTNKMQEENWMMQIQAEASVRWRKLRKLKCNPTRLSISNDMAKWCFEQKIKTKSLINPTASYIYRHVLKKGRWTPPTD